MSFLAKSVVIDFWVCQGNRENSKILENPTLKLIMLDLWSFTIDSEKFDKNRIISKEQNNGKRKTRLGIETPIFAELHCISHLARIHFSILGSNSADSDQIDFPDWTGGERNAQICFSCFACVRTKLIFRAVWAPAVMKESVQQDALCIFGIVFNFKNLIIKRW